MNKFFGTYSKTKRWCGTTRRLTTVIRVYLVTYIKARAPLILANEARGRHLPRLFKGLNSLDILQDERCQLDALRLHYAE